MFFLEAPSKGVLGDGTDIVIPDTMLHQILIEVIEMLRADLVQLDVADGFVDPRQHGIVSVQGRRCKAVPGFQIQHIFRVLGEGFVVIILITVVDVFLEFISKGLDLPLRLGAGHARLGSPGGTVLDGLSLVIDTGRNVDTVVGDFSILIASGFDIWHNSNSFLSGSIIVESAFSDKLVSCRFYESWICCPERHCRSHQHS